MGTEGDKHLQSRIWLEEPEPDNPFAARAAFCHGYDVYGDMLGQSAWADMFHLLFRGEAPTRAQAALLDLLAVALANAGPRDPAVHAAMCGAVGGSPAAACLMAALAVGAGHLSGSREVFAAMQGWRACGCDRFKWQARLTRPREAEVGWGAADHAPGFDPNGATVSVPVMQTLARLSSMEGAAHCAWLWSQRPFLESLAGGPLSFTGLAAAALTDLGFSPEEGEMLFLLLRLPGAAAHALEQGASGHKKFPFYKIELQPYSAAPQGTSAASATPGMPSTPGADA